MVFRKTKNYSKRILFTIKRPTISVLAQRNRVEARQSIPFHFFSGDHQRLLSNHAVIRVFPLWKPKIGVYFIKECDF